MINWKITVEVLIKDVDCANTFFTMIEQKAIKTFINAQPLKYKYI